MSQSTLDAFYGRNAADDERREAEGMRREGGEAQPSSKTPDSQPKIIKKPDGTIDKILEAPGRPRIII